MGYTHYWKADEPFDTMEWDRLCVVAGMICAAAGVEVHFGIYPEEDTFTVDCNEEKPGETFVLRKNVQDSKILERFCKTNREDYDVVVTAILIVAQSLHRRLLLNSDGGPEEWEEGLELAKKLDGPNLALELVDNF